MAASPDNAPSRSHPEPILTERSDVAPPHVSRILTNFRISEAERAIGNRVNIQDALAAIRQLDALAQPRRRHLAVLAADARTDADRALIVAMARRENIEVRWTLEQATTAEFAERARWTERNPQRLPESHTEPSKRRYGLAEGVRFPAHRPVLVSWTTPTKTGNQQPERRPLFTANKKYDDPAPIEKPIQHGTSTAYNRDKCRCDACKAAKALSRKGVGRVRRANGEPAPHGTTTNYSRGCRCRPCRDAVAAHARKKYAEKKSLGRVE